MSSVAFDPLLSDRAWTALIIKLEKEREEIYRGIDQSRVVTLNLNRVEIEREGVGIESTTHTRRLAPAA